MKCNGGRALNGLGALPGYQTQPNSKCRLHVVQELGYGG